MKLVIATGGSGGHLYPALAVMEEAERRGHQVVLVLGGVKRGVDAPREGVRVPSGPVFGVGIRGLLGGARVLAGTVGFLGLLLRHGRPRSWPWARTPRPQGFWPRSSSGLPFT